MKKNYRFIWDEVTHSFVPNTNTDADTAQAPSSQALPVLIADVPVQLRAADPALNGGRTEVVFIDTSVDGYQLLAAGIRAGVEVVEINASAGGLAQIAYWARSHQGYDAIHIFSHGSEHTLQFGTDTLTESGLGSGAVQTALTEIGHALKADGDLLLYGCNVADGQAGADFIGKLAQITQADVAASNNLTGNAAFGGDWGLEVATGVVETQPLAVDGYQGVLVNASYTDFANAIGGDFVKTFSQSVSGYTLTVTTKDGQMYANTWGYNGLGVNGADMGLWDNLETQVTFSMPGYTFDVQSFVAASGMGTTTLKLTSTKGSYSFTLAETDYHAITPGSANLQGVTSFTLTSNVVNGQFGVSFDDLILGNVQPIATGPSTTITSAALSADTGSNTTDWLTNTAAQTINGTLSAALVAGESVQVSYNGGSTWSTATSTVGSTSWSAITTLAGSGTFQARVINASGNGTAYSHAYTLDTTSPDTTITGNPASLSNSSAANFNFAGTDNVAITSYEISLDGGGYVTGTNFKSYAGLADGSHTLSVRAVDGAGNKDATPATYTWTVDTTVATPTLALNFDTGSSNSDKVTSNAQVSVSGLEVGGTWQYSTNSGVTWTNGSGTGFTLSGGDGAKSVVVRQTDAAGNVSASSPVLAFTLDTTVATPSIALNSDTGSDATDKITNDNVVNISGLETGAEWQYSLDGGTTWNNGTGTSFSMASDTAYAIGAIKVKQTDVAGNVSGVGSNAAAFTEDSTIPTASSITANDLSSPSGSSFTFIINYSDAGGSGVDPGTVDPSNVTVTGPGSVGVLTITGLSFDPSTGIATYTVDAPNSGVWNSSTDAGTYTIAINGSGVGDMAGNSVAAASSAKTFAVSFNTNAAPTNVALSSSAVAENTSTASALTAGSLSSTDPDAANTFTYSIVGGADLASFQISGNSLQFKAGTRLDYETKSSYAVTVRTTDQDGRTYDKVLKVNLTDVNEAPSAIALHNTIIRLPENTSTANPIKVADISITDDAMGTNTVTLSGADAGKFELIGSALFLKAGTQLDFETHANYLLNIQVSDNALQGSSPAKTTFTLNLTNIVEAGQKPVSTAPPKLPAIPTWNTLADNDGDGSPGRLEDYVGALNVTGSLAGDGNGDGILDSLQDSVTSMPFFKTPSVESASGNVSSAFITLVADSLAGRPDTTDANTAQLRNVSQKDAAAHLPADMEMPLGLIHFDALVSQKGQTETFSLYLDSAFSANGYWTQNATGTWVNLASKPYGGQMVIEGGKLRLDFQITDGGEFDADGQSNGVITAVGAMASMPLSLAGQAPVTPELPGSFWF